MHLIEAKSMGVCDMVMMYGSIPSIQKIMCKIYLIKGLLKPGIEPGTFRSSV